MLFVKAQERKGGTVFLFFWVECWDVYPSHSLSLEKPFVDMHVQHSIFKILRYILTLILKWIKISHLKVCNKTWIELNELSSGVFTQAHLEHVLQCGRVHYTAKILGHTPSLTSLPIVHLGAISSPPSPPFSLFSVLLVLFTKNVSTVCTWWHRILLTPVCVPECGECTD